MLSQKSGVQSTNSSYESHKHNKELNTLKRHEQKDSNPTELNQIEEKLSKTVNAAEIHMNRENVKTCSRCGKVNHYGKLCRNQRDRPQR